VRQIFPVQGPVLEPVPNATAGPLPAAVAELARLYGNGAAADPAAPTARGWVRANMVASADGAVTLDGRSRGLSGPADRAVFDVLRSLADLVLVGAGTARTEHYRPVRASRIWPQLRAGRPPVPPVAVVSARLDLAGCEQLVTAAPGPAQTIVITTRAAPADRKEAIGRTARIVEAGTDRVDVAEAIAELAELGYLQVLVEGGPILLGHLLQANRLDELCLTVSPRLVAGSAGRIIAGPAGPGQDPAAARLSLAHVLADDDFLLCRYLAE
jgi:riboflavin biosynthesis pyrimidine reductase